MFRKYIIINSSKKTQCNILPTKLKILKLIYIDIWTKYSRMIQVKFAEDSFYSA